MKMKFDDECLNSILEGANLGVECIKRTYGPDARCCVIKTPAGVRVSKDGATCINEVNDEDSFKQIGIELIREASVKTAKDIGDGSSTVCILTGAIIDNYRKAKEEEIKELQGLSNKVLKYLSKKIKPVDTKEGYFKVATLSANNDEKIGETVAEAYAKVGKDGIVQFEESYEPVDRIEYEEGFRLDSGMASTRFINNSKGVCELHNVMVYISDVKLEFGPDIVEIANTATRESKSLLLIAPGFDSEITMFLASNLNLLKSCMMITPYFRTQRDIITKDIKGLLGPSMFCKKVVLDMKHTLFSGYESDKSYVEEETAYIRKALQEKVMFESDLNFHRKRLANFTSGIANIYIGGYTNAERSEKYDRYEDAIRAVEAAILGGVLPGGGKALVEAAEHLELPEKFKKVLIEPYKILSNGKKFEKEKSFWSGYNFKTGKHGNLFKIGVIEPYLVVKTVLENSISTATMFLNCACAIINNKINYDE